MIRRGLAVLGLATYLVALGTPVWASEGVTCKNGASEICMCANECNKPGDTVVGSCTTALPCAGTTQNTNTPATNTATVIPGPKPALSIPIPGVSLSQMSVSKGDAGDTVTIPWIAQYLIGAYKYATGAAVILATVMLIIGGFEYVMAGSAKGSSSGKTRIVNAVTGLLVVLGAYLILNTINPNLTNLTPIRIITTRRILFVSNETPASAIVRDTSDAEGGEAAATSSNMPYVGQWNYCNISYNDRGRCKQTPSCDGLSIASSGCGIASATMVMAPLTGKSPETLLKELAQLSGDNGFRPCNADCTKCNGTAYAFFTSPKTMGAYGLKGDEVKGKAAIIAQLKAGHPVVVIASKGIFTGKGHYVVFAGINADGTIKVMDPGRNPRAPYVCDSTRPCKNLNPPIPQNAVPQDKAFAAVSMGWYIHK